MTATEARFGNIEFSGKDVPPNELKYDRIAVGSRGELLLLGVIAEAQVIKAVRAILNGGARANIVASKGKIKTPSDPYSSPRNPGNIYATPEGYTLATHKLGYAQVHALFVTRMPGFMRVVTPESLWQELNDSRFTTPLLREWAGYIETELRTKELLTEAAVFNCACGVLAATTSDLDAIVSQGIKCGALVIPQEQPRSLTDV